MLNVATFEGNAITCHYRPVFYFYSRAYKQCRQTNIIYNSSICSIEKLTFDVPVLHHETKTCYICITRDSEEIMFSPCVFVCVSVYVCHDVCPDVLIMNDWCHTNKSLQVHCWGCLVVQVMFHVHMTSLMTSPCHKVGQILKMIYLRQYLSYSVYIAQNVGNAKDYPSGIFNFQYHFR